MTEAAQQIRFALLGDMPAGHPLSAAIEASDRHWIVAAMSSVAIPSAVIDVRRYDHWQPLSADDAIDAALLLPPSPSPELVEAVQQLAAHGKNVIVDAECALPSSVVAELGLLDAEGATVAVPFFAWRADPAICRLHQLVSEGVLGDVMLVQAERTFAAAPSSAGAPALSDDLTQVSLCRDIDLLRWLGGDYSQVTLLRTGVTDGRFASQTLNLAGEGLPDATCVYRTGTDPTWTCEVQGASGTASLRADGEGARLTVNGECVLQQDDVQADPAGCLRLIDDSLQRLPGSLRWQDWTRVHEIQEGMRRSLRRRRTIDLHFETASERSQFKTQMATVGCFVLVYTFFASVLLLLAGAVLDPRDQVQRQAEAAGFVVPQEDFEPGTSRLTPDGEWRLQEMADRWESTAAVVVVEGDALANPDTSNKSADSRRRLETVRHQLAGRGVRRVEERTILRRLTGQGFRTLMMIGRVIAFAPLGVFLLMQILLLIARPSQEHQPPAGTSGGN